MKARPLLLGTIVLAFSISAARAQFTGEYADKNFLNGQAAFQMSLEQNGNAMSVWFSAGYNDGHSIQPVADGTGRAGPKGTVEFTFTDSSHNAGSGTITRAGDDIIVSLKTTHVADSRCLELYRQNMRLKPAGKNKPKR